MQDMTKKLLLCLAFPALLALPPAASGAEATLEVRFRDATLTAEVAQTAEELKHGLMGRESLPEGRGMLFVMPRPDSWCMWMKGTSIPLSVAFILEDGTVSSIVDEMKPFSLSARCAREPVSYALEARKGWFARHGVRPGDKARF